MTSAVSFTKNVAFTSLTRVIVLIAGVGISVMIARVLGPEGKGIYSLAILAPSMVLVLVNMGIGPATVYHIARESYSLPNVIGSNIWLSLFLGSGALLVSTLIVIVWHEALLPEVPLAYILLALALIPLTLMVGNLRHIFQGMQRFGEFNIVSIAQAGLNLLLVAVVLLGLKAGAQGAIAVAVLSSVIMATLLIIWTSKVARGISWRPNRAYLKEATIFGAKAHIANVVQFLNYRLDMFLINGFLNPVAVGFYSIAVGLTERIWLVSQSASTVLYPIVAGERDEAARKAFTPVVSRNVLWITAVGAGIFYTLSHWLVVTLYSEDYSPAVTSVQILLPGIVVLGGSRVLANDLAGRGRPLLNSYISVLGLIINIGLNVLLIPQHGIEGAAWATTASYTVMWVCTVVTYIAISGNSLGVILMPRVSDIVIWKQIISATTSKFLPRREAVRS